MYIAASVEGFVELENGCENSIFYSWLSELKD